MSLSSAVFVAGLLGAASFGMGMLPLSVTFSKSTLASLTTYGTGLLLGAALGVVIPEGVLGIIEANAPRTAIALSLLSGFAFMLVVERQFSSHSPTFGGVSGQASLPAESSSLEFDAELGELERTEGIASDTRSRPYLYSGSENIELRQRAYPLTLGLAVHAFVDGIAMGSAALSASGTDENSGPSRLFIAVFLALVVHKAPTALALTTSLLSMSLPVAECKRHLAIFSSTTPIATLLSYAVLSFFGGSGGAWQGTALLFSGGTFLYVATVLQPALAHPHDDGVDGCRRKLLILLAGIATPYLITALLPEGSDH
ncbi:Zinc/iron permease [Dichomitus squalens]|uniref:Zinc/iron permease n=1 Tax=Dichomitus squalens TaxID=114155 RepID=A0A4V2K8Y7_9APHY|nr:Zinc/iron permease [Dichomitus squalens]